MPGCARLCMGPAFPDDPSNVGRKVSVRYLSSSVAFACAIVCSSPVAAQTTTLTATFARGAIAEYRNGPNGTDNARLFSTLGIASMTVSQQSSNGSWGGSQGNDTAITAKITFTNGMTTSFPAAINWVKNAGQGSFDWIGLTIGASTTVADGYPLTTGREKTYILQFAQSGFDMTAAVQADPNSLDGSANAGAAISALNLYFPTAVAAAPVITGPTGGAGAATSAISVYENQTAVTTLTANRAVNWAITGGTDGAKFAISAGGVVTFLAAPDFEGPTDADTNNSYVLIVTATDSNGGTSTQTITVTVLNVDEALPVVAPDQSLNYGENRPANDTVGTVAATDNVAVTQFRFAASGTQTSADGYYTIDNAGVIRITTAGVAAGVANNDFETAPNSFTYAVQAGDAAKNWSAATDIDLIVTDIDEAAPVVTGGQSFSYAENQSANAAVGTVAASDNLAVSAFRFAATGNQTSADGFYSVDNDGVLRLTAAGAAARAATNDFETAPNSFTYALEAGDAAGNWSTQVNVTLAITDVNEAVNSPPSVGAGQTISYAENRSANAVIGTAAATDDVGVTAFRFAATGTQTSADGYYTIDNGGVVRITTAGVSAGVANNDFEISPNSFVYAIEAGDASGSWSAPANVTFAVTDLADSPPVITGPGGSTGAAASISVPEGTTSVTQVTANVPISNWAIVGGNDQGRFSIDAQGNITFTAAPDFEAPTDSDTDNSYLLVIEGTDASGNKTTQTITVNVTNVRDNPPVITGPGGSTGGTATISVPENTTSVTQVSSSVSGSTWAITGGNDQGRFSIDAQGRITFTSAPDFEAPADSDTDNSYVLVIEATAPDGSKSTQTITVNVTDIADNPPVITGPGGSTSGNATISVPENTTSVTQVSSSVSGSTWAITGGNDQGRFSIDAQGRITFTSAPDFETPTDSDTNNSYVLVIEASAPDGSKSTQTITVNVTNLADMPPVITGPNGSGGGAAAISVPEGTTAVTQVTSSVAGTTWAITSGNDQGRFTIDAQGNIRFVQSPDFEAPTDSDTNNSYVLVVEATAPDGSKTTQTITVNVTNIPDTPPVITGPSGGAGALASAIAVNEGTTAVSTLTSNRPVTWSIIGGTDRGQFSINAQGQISFVAAPNFEAPTDSDRNNSYVLIVEAEDANGERSQQTITVSVVNVDELQRKLNEIGANLRSDVRNHAFASLSSMLSFNEGLLGLDDQCASAGSHRPLSGGLNANEDRQDARLGFARDLSSCEARTRMLVDGGIGFSRVDKNWTTRGLASARLEHLVGTRTVLGAALIGTAASDDLASFGDGRISDESLQLNVYGRTHLSKGLRFAAFAGVGRAWYQFRLEDGGLDLDGEATGKRHLYGAALSGDIRFGGLTVTTDAILSRAVEKLGHATLDASFAGESGRDTLFRLGRVDITRLSVPVHVPILFDSPKDGREATRLDISPGLLCQDTAADSSALDCGYQLGFKFRLAPSVRSLLRAEARTEAVDGYLLNSLTVGYLRRFGSLDQMSWGMDASRMAGGNRDESRVVFRVGVGR